MEFMLSVKNLESNLSIFKGEKDDILNLFKNDKSNEEKNAFERGINLYRQSFI